MGALRHLRALTSKVYPHLVPLHPQAQETLQSSSVWGGCTFPSFPPQREQAARFCLCWQVQFIFKLLDINRGNCDGLKALSAPAPWELSFFLFVCPNSSYSCSGSPAIKVSFFFPHTSHHRVISLTVFGKDWCDCPAPFHALSVTVCHSHLHDPITEFLLPPPDPIPSQLCLEPARTDGNEKV